MDIGHLVGRGRTADIYEWEDEKVVKLFKSGFSMSSIEWEFDINSKIYESIKGNGIRIPKPFEIIKLEDRMGIVFEMIQGRTMLEEISKKPWKVKTLSKKLGGIHNTIHQNVNGSLLSYRLDLQFQIDKAPFLSDEVKKKLLEMVAKLEDSNEICHGDLHPDNIILSPKGPVVIDWLNARRGNKLLDLARTSIMIKYGHIPPDKSFIMKAILKKIRNVLYKDYLKAYLKVSGTSIEEVEKWEAPIAAARLNEGIPVEEKKILVEMIQKRLINKIER